MQKLTPQTADEARTYAIDWQNWLDTQAMSYSEMIEWYEHFQDIVELYPELKDEFIENAII